MAENEKILKQVLRAAQTIVRNYTVYGRVEDIEKYKNGGFAFSFPLSAAGLEIQSQPRYNYGTVDCIVDIINDNINIITTIEFPITLDNDVEAEIIKNTIEKLLPSYMKDVTISFETNYDGSSNLPVSARFVATHLTNLIVKAWAEDRDRARELVGEAIAKGVNEVAIAISEAFRKNDDI